MAFSRSEDRELKPISTPHSSAATPSPVSPLSPTSEETVVDADAIERWLTSKPGSTGRHSEKTPHVINSSRGRLVDVTFRRRRQQMLHQHQTSQPKLLQEDGQNETIMISSSASLAQRHGEQKKVTKYGTASPAIAAIRRRRQQRLKRKDLDKELLELEREHQRDQFATTMATPIDTERGNTNDSTVACSSCSSSSSHREKKLFEETKKAIPISPPATNDQLQETHYRNYCLENKTDDYSDFRCNNKANLDSQNVEAQSKEMTGLGDKRFFSVSRTKKIYLLKRHSKTAGSLEDKERSSTSPSLTGDMDDISTSDKTSVSKIDQYQTLRRQISDGSDSDTREKKLEERSLSAAVDNCRASPSRGKGHPSTSQSKEEEDKPTFENHHRQRAQEQQGSQVEPHKNRQCRLLPYHDDPNMSHRNDNPCRQKIAYDGQEDCNVLSQTSKIRSDNAQSKINNTRRIKEALARAKSHRRLSKRKINRNETNNDSRRHDDMIYDGGFLKNQFQSESISCSSVVTTGTSTISVVSVDSSCKSCDSQTSEDESTSDDEDDVTTATSVSIISSNCDEKDRDSVSQLPTLTKQKAPAENLPKSLLEPSSGCEMGFVTKQDSSIPMDYKMLTPTLNRYEPSTTTVDKYAVATSLAEPKQQFMDTTLVGSSNDVGEAAIATLVKATIGSSSAINRNPPERKQQRMQVREKTSRIKLHVYDLVSEDTQLDLWGCHLPLGQVFNALNSSLHSIGTGAYHVGLEINGIEYAYGANSVVGQTGVFTCMPKSSPGYQFRTTIDFGNRVVRKKWNGIGDKVGEAIDGREIVRQMAAEYLGTDYDLLRKNCCTFARDVCIRLGIGEKDIPTWFHNLAEVGAVTQDAANYTLAPITQLFSGSELDKFADYLNEASMEENFEAIQDKPSEN